MAKKKPNDYGTGIPPHEVEALARVLRPEMQKFFESEGSSGSERNGKTEMTTSGGASKPDAPPLLFTGYCRWK